MTSVQGLLGSHECMGDAPAGPGQEDGTSSSRPRPWGSISLQRLNFCSNAASLLDISAEDRAAESELWQVRTTEPGLEALLPVHRRIASSGALGPNGT